jgi:predicted lactoylglutathione lyase
MPRMIFVNLPVADVEAAKRLYLDLGLRVNPVFTTEDCASIVVEDNIVIMLLAEPRFRDFIRNDIAHRDTTEVLVCLSADSREAVDELCDKALAAGAEAWKEPQDHGVMYGRSFRDLDGHVIEVMWMDVQAATGLSPEEAIAAAV